MKMFTSQSLCTYVVGWILKRKGGFYIYNYRETYLLCSYHNGIFICHCGFSFKKDKDNRPNEVEKSSTEPIIPKKKKKKWKNL